MAFKRKRKNGSGKRFTKRKFGGRKLHKRIRRIERAIETKVHETIQSGAFTGGTVYNTIWNLATITVGTAFNQRIANEVACTSLSMRGRVHWGVGTPATVTTVGQIRTIRNIIVWDKQPNGGTLVIGDIMGTIGPAVAYYGPIEWDVRKRFRVLMDKSWNLIGGATNNCFTVKKHFKLKRKKIRFTSGANTQEQNALYSIWIADAIDATNLMEYEVYTRLKYQDS